MKRILGVLLAGVLLLSGCGQWQKSQKESAYHLYCLDKTGTTLVQEPYEPKEGTDQKLIKELVDALQEKPAKDGNQALLSNGISIKTYTLENGLLTLNLSGEYGELARPQEVLVRAGLVRTFVQVPEVERVTLLIDGDPLKDSKGREIGTMTADSFLENSGREIYQYQYATLTLYFANEAGDHLVKETRRVPYSTNIPLERVVVEQLMKGPKEDGHYAVLPDTMNVLSVTTSDRIAYVNFDKSFKDSALSSVAEQIPIYAVVDSITTNCKVDKVQFSINGESDVTFRAGELTVSVLHPGAGEDYTGEENAGSVVLQLSCGACRALLTGDLEGSGEEEVLGAAERCQILKVAHHGSRNSTSEAFLNRIQPQISLISCAWPGRYGHPHRELLERLRACKSHIYGTPVDGAVTVQLKRDRLAVHGYRSDVEFPVS